MTRRRRVHRRALCERAAARQRTPFSSRCPEVPGAGTVDERRRGGPSLRGTDSNFFPRKERYARMRTARRLAGLSEPPVSDAIVRRFFGDDHVVDVALAQALRGDPDEPALLRSSSMVFAAGVAHAGAQAPDELGDDRARASRGRARGLRCPRARASRRPRRPDRSDPCCRASSRRSSPCLGTPCSCGPGRGRARRALRRCRRTASRSSRWRRRRRWP